MLNIRQAPVMNHTSTLRPSIHPQPFHNNSAIEVNMRKHNGQHQIHCGHLFNRLLIQVKSITTNIDTNTSLQQTYNIWVTHQYNILIVLDFFEWRPHWTGVEKVRLDLVIFRFYFESINKYKEVTHFAKSDIF